MGASICRKTYVERHRPKDIEADLRIGLQLFVVPGREVDQDFLDLLHGSGLERLHLPEALGRGPVAVVGLASAPTIRS